ncbi:hypothetical protein ACFWBK_02240, partial [Streptomyces sp. NPDC059990]
MAGDVVVDREPLDRVPIAVGPEVAVATAVIATTVTTAVIAAAAEPTTVATPVVATRVRRTVAATVV